MRLGKLHNPSLVLCLLGDIRHQQGEEVIRSNAITRVKVRGLAPCARTQCVLQGLKTLAARVLRRLNVASFFSHFKYLKLSTSKS